MLGLLGQRGIVNPLGIKYRDENQNHPRFILKPLSSNISPFVKDVETFIFSQDWDTAPTLGKGRGDAHKSEIIGVKYLWRHTALSSSLQRHWSASRSCWRVDLDNQELFHSFLIFVFCRYDNHMNQICPLSMTGMQFSLGVFIYRQIIHLAALDPEWQTKCSYRDASDYAPCSTKLQKDFRYTDSSNRKGQYTHIFRCECEMRKCLSFYLVSECFGLSLTALLKALVAYIYWMIVLNRDCANDLPNTVCSQLIPIAHFL